MNTKEVLFFIPLYNEEKYIAGVLRDIRKYSKNDILIINDGSKDSSRVTIEKISRELPGNLYLINHENNEGYGKTLIDGFDYSVQENYRFILTIDGDGQHEPENIPHFINIMKNSSIDILSGSRYLDPGKMANKPPRDRYRINSKITNLLNRITGYQLTDSFCGFKIYRVDALKKLKLTEKGYGLPLQLLIQAYKNNLKIKELPIELIYTDEKRTFGPVLDDSRERLHYYLKIIRKELKKI